MDDNRKKALGAALSQIERQFGKELSCGGRETQGTDTFSIDGFSRSGYCAGYCGICLMVGLWKFRPGSGKTTLTLQVIQKHSVRGRFAPSSMRSTRWIPFTPKTG